MIISPVGRGVVVLSIMFLAACGGPGTVADAGSPDPGADAGLPDAGALDAGVLDAGTLDAGTPDAGTPDAGPTCAGGCDDSNLCTADTCTFAGCQHAPVDGAACDDGNLCTTSDVCAAGTCAGTAVVCPAPGVCQLQGTCAPATGQCTQPHADAGTPCTDANPATSGDVCDGTGACVGVPVVCPVDTPCTTWRPDGTATCVATLHPGAACDDGSLATADDRCTATGTCAGTPVTCPADTACTHYAFNGTATCTATNLDGATCDDTNPCTPSGTCSAGACVVGAAVTCVNGGTCANGACSCPAGWKGPTCATDVDECAAGACGGGSTCTNTPGSYTCQCVTNYSSPSGANCTSTTTALEVVIFYDESVERKFGPQTPARIASIFNRAKSVYDSGGLTPSLTLSLNGVSRLSTLPSGIELRTCDTVMPGTTCTGCYVGGSSSACGTLLSNLASEIDTAQLLQSFSTWFTTRKTQTNALFDGVDVAFFLTDADFSSSELGLAWVSGACHTNPNGVVSTHGLMDDAIGSSLAHELGHTLGMVHDASGSWVMSPTVASPPNTQFSPASILAYQQWRTNNGSLACISDVARSNWRSVVCGNGLVDTGEQCDPSVQSDACCASTCQLSPGCACGNTEPCCSLGALAPRGRTCRAASGECDLAETCDGVTSACPDQYRSPFEACSNTGYCLRGVCVSRGVQCANINAQFTSCESSTQCNQIACSTAGQACSITYLGAADDGTRCGSNAQCVSGLCVPSASLKDYSWRVGAWSACANHLHTRTVTCVDEAGVTAASNLCDPDAQPAASGSCP